MPRIEVETGQLYTASGRQVALAEQLTTLSGSLDSAGSSAAAAAGEAEAAAVIGDCCAAWSVSLSMLADSVGGLGANLGSAASAYDATDADAMPRGAR